MDQVTNPRPDLYIGGEWRQGRGAGIESHFPADGSLNAIVSGASIEDVDFAIERAQEAVNDKAWRRLLPMSEPLTFTGSPTGSHSMQTVFLKSKHAIPAKR
jgi:hypothetical protein